MAVSLKSGTRHDCPLSPNQVSIVFKALTREIRQKTIKEMQIGKEKVKDSVYADDVIVFIRNPQHPTRELLCLINT